MSHSSFTVGHTVLPRESRVRKFNIGTEPRMALGQSLREFLAERPEGFDRIESSHRPSRRDVPQHVKSSLPCGILRNTLDFQVPPLEP